MALAKIFLRGQPVGGIWKSESGKNWVNQGFLGSQIRQSKTEGEAEKPK